MSLESKIEALTLAVQQLTAVIKSDIQQDFTKAVSEEVSKVVDEVKETSTEKEPEFFEEEINQATTHADFKDICLKVARSGKKEEVKAVIASYGVSKSIDVPSDKLAEAYQKVEAL